MSIDFAWVVSWDKAYQCSLEPPHELCLSTHCAFTSVESATQILFCSVNLNDSIRNVWYCYDWKNWLEGFWHILLGEVFTFVALIICEALGSLSILSSTEKLTFHKAVVSKKKWFLN